MCPSQRSQIRGVHNTLLNWVLVLVVALVPVETAFAGIQMECHSPEAVPMAGMPDHHTVAMDADAVCEDGCCQCVHHSSGCGNVGCGTAQVSAFLAPYIQETIGTSHSIPPVFYSSLHSRLFAYSLYRPPQTLRA